jgi:ribosomal protein L11 methyltransferase
MEVSSDRDRRLQACRVLVPRQAEEMATAVLWELGSVGIELKDQPKSESEIVAYFDAPDMERLLRLIAARFNGIVHGPITSLPVAAVDWTSQWRENFHQVNVGPLTIAPPWALPLHSSWIVIEPARAFGTGTHETTQLCLEWLVCLSRAGPLGTVLDVGTGTGVLALSAARLGASRVYGIDIDADAIAAARRHARRNGLALPLLCADGACACRASSVDVVVANIDTPWLIERNADLRGLARRATVLSGFLESDVDALRAVYSDYAQTLRYRGEWAAMLLTDR